MTISELLRRPGVAAALVALIAGQTVMVLIMTMTPVHMTAHGHGVETVGLVISGHTFGMYALAPLSGRLTDRFGTGWVIVAGLVILAGASAMAAVAPPDGGVVLFAALFLLGFGWNLGFVAGSTMLTQGVEVGQRTRLQGLADSLDLEHVGGSEPRFGRRLGGGELHGAGPARRRPYRRPVVALPHPNARPGASGVLAGRTSAQLSDHPRGEDAGTVADLGQRDVLVGAVGKRGRRRDRRSRSGSRPR